MKRPLIVATAAVVLGIGASLFLVPQSQVNAQSTNVATETATATFAIENMTCALCPITVRKAMEGVEGVRSVQTDLEARTATAVFDPRVVSPADIAAASTNAGYPARSKP
ncbi:MAG: heavy metal transporter [Rhizobiales bacterium NRL2]|jgi:mercuric ion binding protein|nr:MAG: heavy metal transporter [Rhizobiales bacterium NRL2]